MVFEKIIGKVRFKIALTKLNQREADFYQFLARFVNLQELKNWNVNYENDGRRAIDIVT